MTSYAATLLLVEDEESFVDALTVGLTREGFKLVVARDGVEAMAVFRREHADLVLLDLMLPRTSGLDVCRAIRSESSVPIILLTAKSSEIDIVLGLELGADDYITKPYRLQELIARIRAALRKAEHATGGAAGAEPVLTVGDVALDPARHTVTVRGALVPLPLKQFELLQFLMENAGRVCTRVMILDRIWGFDYVGDTKTLDVHVKRLRGHIEDDPADPKRISTVRGVGYRFEVAAGSGSQTRS